MIEAGAQGIMIPVEDSFAAWRKDPEYVKPTTRSRTNSRTRACWSRSEPAPARVNEC